LPCLFDWCLHVYVVSTIAVLYMCVYTSLYSCTVVACT